ncbi:hypothetical protein HYU19_02330 [Candidatus Woesearchaeota archaeon]|nr:hypothetical protein [Candidatus Woesearchaeota archaeon]
MRLSNKLIETVVSQVAGNDVLPLVQALKNKKNVSEFKLAESIQKEINTTRNMLYRLYHANLVSFIRRKDKQKGWYIYYWTFRVNRVRPLMKDLKKQRLEKLKERLHREKDEHFFLCANKCMRLTFDQAVDFNYKCPECGGLMDREDNEERILKIREEITMLEGDLQEIAKENAKI